MAIDGRESAYACKCLNVRIRRQPSPGAPPDDLGDDAEYTPIFVGEEGIFVAHPQLTLRTILLGAPIPETSRTGRHTAISCLICHASVYRVHQIVSLDVEAIEGPLLPTDDWVEQDTLKSANGWIEVHKDCMTDDAITQAEQSPLYSKLFSVVLPRDPMPTPAPKADAHLLPASQSPQPQSPPSPVTYLPHMRPLFPPPPFTPSHPVFTHLSTVASRTSQDLRNTAEEYLAQVVRDKVAEIEQAETELRRHVEVLWREFREGLDKVDRDRSPNRPPVRRDSENWPITNAAVGAGGHGTPMSIREFVPVPSPSPRAATAASLPRRSSLSASLATSSFHYPRDRQERTSTPPQGITNTNSRSPPPYSSNPASPASSPSFGSRGSSRSASFLANVEASNILEPFRRNMDQSLDVAASFRYFTNLEAEMTRAAASRQQEGDKDHQEAPPLPDQPGESSTAADVPDKGHKKQRSNGSGSRSSRDPSRGRKGSDSQEPRDVQDNGVKGKRKVTFDVKPDVVTIKREMNAEKQEENEAGVGHGADDMIFVWEDDGSERGASESASKSVFALLDHSQGPIRPARSRGPNNTDLQASFSNLRPASLPVPSKVRPPSTQSQSELDSTAVRSLQPSRGMLNVAKPDHRRRHSAPILELPQESEPLDPQDAEILKLVAADTPSHRGAWKRDSKAWQTFVRRKGGKASYHGRGFIAEEAEDDDKTNEYHMNRNRDFDDTDEGDSDSDDVKWRQYKSPSIASSLPIAIGPFGKKRENLSLSSYQPKTSLSDRPGLLVPPLRYSTGRSVSSSVALRKAAYAERDRVRSMDPGALDFAAEDEDDLEQSDNEDSATDEVATGERGRQHALKILQARNEMPSAGMWRSLA